MPTRRLSSIMFADIAGYTAMMQENETAALQKVKRFRTVLDELVPAHGGKVVQYYGDGSLMVFDSAVQAVQCGKAIQLATREQPTLPLRIGIHLGDIVIDGENIYGDGVNMASRVESLGVPGAVLFTERIIQDIHNHPELPTVSCGEFHFKNAKTPTEVFALTGEGLRVPRRADMQGKLEPPQAPSLLKRLNQKNTRLTLASILTIGLGITGYSLRDILFPSNGRAEALAMTVFVHGPGGKQDVLLSEEGTLLADFGSDRRSAHVGENGRTVFSEVPAQFAQEGAMLSLQADGFQVRHPDSVYLLTGDPVYLEIEQEAQTVMLRGQILDASSLEPVAGVRVMSEGIATLTDSLGNYRLELPRHQPEYLYRLIANKPGYRPLNERRAWVDSRIELRLMTE